MKLMGMKWYPGFYLSWEWNAFIFSDDSFPLLSSFPLKSLFHSFMVCFRLFTVSVWLECFWPTCLLSNWVFKIALLDCVLNTGFYLSSFRISFASPVSCVQLLPSRRSMFFVFSPYFVWYGIYVDIPSIFFFVFSIQTKICPVNSTFFLSLLISFSLVGSANPFIILWIFFTSLDIILKFLCMRANSFCGSSLSMSFSIYSAHFSIPYNSWSQQGGFLFITYRCQTFIVLLCSAALYLPYSAIWTMFYSHVYIFFQLF